MEAIAYSLVISSVVNITQKAIADAILDSDGASVLDSDGNQLFDSNR